jgi:hypothetical protein
MGLAQRSTPAATLLVRKDATGESLYTTRAYGPGDVVFQFEEVEWRPQRDRHTIQHPTGGHIFHPVLAKTAHSCDPNCCVSFPNRAMVAIRPIAAGEATPSTTRPRSGGSAIRSGASAARVAAAGASDEARPH